MRDGRIVSTIGETQVQQTGERELAEPDGRPTHERSLSPAARRRARPWCSACATCVYRIACAHVPFELHRGEILGFAGLIGAGRTELGEAIAGLRKRSGGEIRVDGARV